MRWWDLEKGQHRESFELHDRPVLCVDLSADGRRALSGGADGVLCLWDLSGTRPNPSR